MAQTTCAKCGREFKYPCHLRRHEQRKTPCAILPQELAPAHACPNCKRSFAQKSSLYRHVREYCPAKGQLPAPVVAVAAQPEQAAGAETAKQLEEVKQQLAELKALLSLTPAPAHVISAVGASGRAKVRSQTAAVINNGPVQNTCVNVAVTCWNVPGGPLPPFTPEFLTGVFAHEELRKFREMPMCDQMSPDIAPPYVLRSLLETVRSAHQDPAYRNVYLNPKRADQVLVCIDRGGEFCWEVREVAEATRVLFNAATERMTTVTTNHEARERLPKEFQDVVAWVPILYNYEPERYVEDSRKAMMALLENTREMLGRQAAEVK